MRSNKDDKTAERYNETARHSCEMTTRETRTQFLAKGLGSDRQKECRYIEYVLCKLNEHGAPSIGARIKKET